MSATDAGAVTDIQESSRRSDTGLGPVPESGRILALDAARGFALLGILFVNIQFFAMPFGSFLQLEPPDGAANAAAFYFTKIFCQGKFYPLFSMMFGIGLVLQRRRAEARGAGFGAVYARRLLILATFGALHGLLLWYGDILFMYAIVGFVLLLASRLSGRAMLMAGGGVLLWAVLLIAGGSALTGYSIEMQKSRETQNTGELVIAPDADAPNAADPEQEGAAPEIIEQEVIIGEDGEMTIVGPSTPAEPAHNPVTPAGGNAVNSDSDAPDSPAAGELQPEGKPAAGPGRELIRMYQQNQIQGGPDHPEYMRLETLAYQEGPWLDAFIFRSFSFIIMLVFAAVGFGWTVLASFFFGAGLYKLGLFEERRLGLVKIGVAVGLGAGLPITLLGHWTLRNAPPTTALPVLGVTEAVGGVLMAFGYLCGMILLGHARSSIARLLAPLGRMALTNYLLQTVIATAIFYHWGLGRFGTMGRGELALVVLGIYIFQIGLSHLWLSRFRMGPMEWLWRRFTYLSPVKMSREDAA